MREITGYENYAVTEEGQVYNKKFKRWLTPKPTKGGYLQVILYNNGESKPFYVHRLVAQAYLPNPDNLPEVNHIDEKKHNNHVSNLEWVTSKENANHGTRNKRMGDKHAKLIINLETLHIYGSMVLASELTGTHKDSISNCCRGRQKTAGGCHWCYLEDYLEHVA